ncbi:Cytochrome P450 3A11 like protein [Argiope bruennichi]|uniref:Cytochrome P450 3A11 like protein n=1 Tax=Argiope bruennichi TaxID=94029 RepID=A0A8T0G267_ARGBR|nr:Cytochrome P450 3A11 like protein [Argiope bruennichi]
MLDLLLEPFLITSFIGIFTIILFYRLATKNHDYWKDRGIPYVKPLPFFGSTLENLKKPLYQVQIERYRQLGPIHGFFEANTPILTIGVPTLLRDIMVKDFPSFTSRRKVVTGDKVVDKMLSIVQGDDWKRIRSIITPTFTTGKLKRMLSIFKDCSETLVKNFKAAAEEGKPVDAKRIYGAFTMDVIASAAFSTKIDSHNDPDNKFVKSARAVFGGRPGMLFVLFTLFPKMVKLFRLFRPSAARPTDFFRDITLQIVEQRRKTGQARNDFLQLLLDTAKEVSEEEKWDEDKGDIDSNYAEQNAGQQMFKTVSSKKLSMDELVSQCVIFFLAGYETTASTLSFASYLLALNPDVQDKLREEVDKAIAETNGELTYETVQNMKYLDNVISETLRLFPPAVRLERYADADYKLPGLGLKVPKQMCINIPVYAMHRDPKYFPDPERFDPDRFTAEEKAKRDPFTYLPFGAGPRNCIGMRFALLEIKVCLSYILSNFKIKRSPRTKDKLEFQLGVTGLLMPKEILVEMEVRPVSRLVN